ncbi:ABC transporter permease [Dactylosporangium sp. NPDC000521]|uniref:ABC transporter permease n=1 Tax=Dactylosporangium sp. NPDC000521 TaxID=3363975 RepID=UPI0036A77B51
MSRLIWLSLVRGGLEVKLFFRERDAVAFTFALPVVLLALLGSAFGHRVPGEPVTTAQFFAAGMIAGGVGSTTFLSLGVGIANDRYDGTLKRLRGTPIPPAAYFIGRAVLAFVVTLAEVALLLLVGRLAFGVPIPATPGRWFTFVWLMLLGVTACALLGVAASAVPRSARSAGAVLNLPYLVLQFVSGIFIVPVTTLPRPLQLLGAAFPLKWLAQGFRSVFLPDALAAHEPAHTWEHGRTALVLAAWCVGGLLLCLRTFRWTTRTDA